MRQLDRHSMPAFLFVVALLQACDDVPIPPTGQSGGTREDVAADSVEMAGTVTHTPDGQARAGSEQGGLGEGFLVWESNRTGSWRLWTRRLDGSGLRQLVGDEAGRQHYAPHISPDGKLLAYLSAEDGGKRYPEGGVLGELRLLDLESGETRVLVGAARTYFENRAVVWRSPGELIFIGGDLVTKALDLASGRVRDLTAEPGREMGYLVDAPLAHASSNSATFSVFDAKRRRVVPRADLGGCQAYFTHDGRWGVWTAGAGGPIEKMDLGTRQVGRVLDKNDAGLPDGLGYLYFPMPSRDSRLLAFAASRNEHDHFQSDYEIFVIETDAETLERIGPPVRFTWDKATDRYPDVFAEPLELGLHRGEAPFELALSAPGGGSWSWSMGDGTTVSGAAASHRYTRPGRFRIEAARGEGLLRGQVVVVPSRPPSVAGARLSGDSLSVLVDLDEPVASQGAELGFESGRSIRDWRLDDNARRIVIDLEEPFTGVDRLILSGVSDRAQEPNRMPETVIEVGPPSWPVDRRGLVYVWQTGDAPNLLPDPEGGPERAITLRAKGRARLDHHWVMQASRGFFQAEAEDSSRVKEALQRANEVSLQFTVKAPVSRERTPLVTFSTGRRLNFQLFLRAGRLVFELQARSPRQGPAESVELFPLAAGRPNHVTLTYSPARLSAYLDGERRLELGSEAIKGDFFHWRDAPLRFGGAPRGDLRLEGVAIHDRALSASEVRADFERYRDQKANRKEVPRVAVEARLIRKTAAPTLDDISPYREALVVFEYEVVRSIGGDAALARPGERVRVAHWAILDGERLPLNDRSEGSVHKLGLEPFDANPQLASLFLGEASAIDGALPLHYAPDPGP